METLLPPNIFQQQYVQPYSWQNIKPYEGFFNGGGYTLAPYVDSERHSSYSEGLLKKMIHNRETISEQVHYNTYTGTSLPFGMGPEADGPSMEDRLYYFDRFTSRQIMISAAGLFMFYYIFIK